LKKGEKSTKILFWNVTDDPEDSTQKKYFSKYYHVFNLEQTNLIPLDFLEEEREVPEFIKARTILQQYRDRPVMKL